MPDEVSKERKGLSWISGKDEGGFTLMELLAVVAVIAILASLLLAAIGGAKSFAKGGQCVSNLKQLQQAWLMYADDHRRLAPNHDGVEETNTWVRGWLSFDADWQDSTNKQYLVDPEYAALAEYVSDPKLYRCPSDNSRVTMGGTTHDRVRSYSMNQAMGLSEEGAKERTDDYHLTAEVHVGKDGAHVEGYRRMGDIRSSSKRWVLIEEHPDSINDGTFCLGLPQSGASKMLWDVPAPYHGESSAIAFADGHAELHSWNDNQTIAPIKHEQNLLSVPTKNGQDFQWLASRMSRRVGVSE